MDRKHEVRTRTFNGNKTQTNYVKTYKINCTCTLLQLTCLCVKYTVVYCNLFIVVLLNTLLAPLSQDPYHSDISTVWYLCCQYRNMFTVFYCTSQSPTCVCEKCIPVCGTNTHQINYIRDVLYTLPASTFIRRTKSLFLQSLSH
jgi:hypothetical protein